MITTLCRIGAICAVALLLCPGRAHAAADDLDIGALQARGDAIHSDYAKPHSPGAMIAFVQGGKAVFVKGYGYANREYSAPWTAETRYTFFSITKSMVDLALFRLQDQGRLKLTDPVGKYLPDFPLGGQVRIVELMNHTSGLWQDEDLALIAGLNASEDPVTLQELYGLMQKQETLPYRPGSNYYYNDGGMRLAARILEKVTGKSFDAAMRELVFDPAGMKTASTKPYEPAFYIGQATPYALVGVDYDKLGTVPVRVANGLYENSGDGAGVGTMNDYIAYLRYLTGYVDGVRWIDRLVAPTQLRLGYVSPYRFGFVVASHRGLPVILHGGYMGKRLAYLRDFDLWVVMTRNALDYDRASDAQRLEDLIDAALQSSAKGRYYLSADNPLREETLRKPADQGFSKRELAELAGRYFEPESGLVIDISVDGDAKFLRLATRFLGTSGYLVRPPGRVAQTYQTFANGHTGSPDPVSIRIHRGVAEMTYADWEAPRQLTRIAVDQLGQASSVPGLPGMYRSRELDTIYQVKAGPAGLRLLVGPGNRVYDRFDLKLIAPDVLEARPVDRRSGRPVMQMLLVRTGGEVVGLKVNTVGIKNLALRKVELIER